ncbi:MAG: DUF1622 domain-containing protein [Variovorax sp.]|nr:MAG: DUF1622 domain-containing protein [Variovorax sp.]
MEHLVETITHYAALSLELTAVILIVIGAVEALVGMVRLMFAPHASLAKKRMVWLEFARWLVAGLTFQLAGDIIRTSIAPTWDDLGRLATIAVLRAFISFTLDRDMQLREHEADSEPHRGP